MKALKINVYRRNDSDGSQSDCTNGGISAKYDQLLLVCDSGIVEIDENNPPENLVKVVTRQLFGREYKHIEPVARPKNGNLGWMYGGNIASCSDSRFHNISEYPLCIHDRQETVEQYEMLSR